MKTYLFAVIGGLLLAIALPGEASLILHASMVLGGGCFFLALQSVQDKNYTIAGVDAVLSWLLSGFWFFGAEAHRQILWIAAWIVGLLIVWPLRFVALGEIASALLGTAFLYYIGVPGTKAFYLLTSLLLLCAAFHDSRTLYTQHKAVQHYSLPVLLGSLIPALDRRWQHPASPLLHWLLPPLYWLTLATFLYY